MKRKPFVLPDIPPWEEIDQLLRATRTQRDRLLLMLAAFMGLRVSELVDLDVSHLDFRRNQLRIEQGKNSKDAFLPIPKFLLGPLRGFIGGRPAGPLFLSRKNLGRLTPRAVQHLVKRIADKAGLPDARRARKYHPHCLRHVFCTEKIRRRVPLAHVQRLMRHSNIQTTLRYTHLVTEDLREAIEA